MTMTEITIDFETRSPVDIKSRGAFVYAEHPDTEIMCLSVGVGAERPLIWMADKFAARVNAPLVRGGGSSWIVPLSTRAAIACSSMRVVAKSHMGALVLLSEIFAEAFSKALLLDMKQGRAGFMILTVLGTKEVVRCVLSANNSS